MFSRTLVLGLLAMGLLTACGPTANVERDRGALLEADRACSQGAAEVDRFVSCFAEDATIYPQGMPVQTGSAAIRETYTKFHSAPGFALTWTPTKAEVAGDLGYTVGTYQLTTNDAAGSPVAEQGKYVSIWRRQADGGWKIVEDIFNADAGPASGPPLEHVVLKASELTWGDPPPALPAGAKVAVVSGDPSKGGPFVIRAQVPAGYRIAPHWHPTDEHVTVLSGTFAVGHGEQFDQAALKEMPANSFAAMPAEMRHFAMAKTAATIQVHGKGPFVVNYVNPADDPRQQGQPASAAK
jgi:ketosteroid isomerase-like protein